MATISFRTKVKKVYNADDTLAFEEFSVPKFNKSHCDMDAFRKHPKYGWLANSDFFNSVLLKIRKEIAPTGKLRMDNLPKKVKLVKSGFISDFEIEV